jgi:hypothetical protein
VTTFREKARGFYANQWKAKTTEEVGLKAIDTEAVMGLATPQREGETEAEEKYAIVHVSVKRDPRYFDTSPELEEALRAMLEKANQMADQSFLKRHPEAKIEHIDESSLGSNRH